MIKYAGIGIIGAAALLAGCGGGGGGSASLTYDGPTAAVVIDETNADGVAGFAAGQATSGDVGGLAGTIPLGVAVSSAENTAPSTIHSLGAMAKKYADMALGTSSSGPTILSGLTESASGNCTDGGKISIKVVYSDPNQPTAGDSFKLSFNNCVEGTEKLDGSVTLVLNTFDWDPVYQTIGDFSASFTFSNLKATDLSTGDYAWVNGGYTAGFTGDGSTSDLVASLTGNSLVVEESIGGIVEQHRLTDFYFVDTLYTNGNVSFDHDYTIASTDIGGSITVETVTPFTILSGHSYPYEGQLIVTGANNAKVRLTAQADETHVYVEYDIVPIDGIYEANALVLWTDL